VWIKIIIYIKNLKKFNIKHITKISAKAPTVTKCHRRVRCTMYRLSSYGLRMIFDSDIMYTSCSLDRIHDWWRVISISSSNIECNCWTVSFGLRRCSLFRLYSVLHAVHSQRVHLRSESYEFGHYMFSSFIRPDTFLFAKGILYALFAG